MKIVKILITLWMLVFSISSWAIQQHALLIGISNYQHERDLPGARNDVEALRKTLINTVGFQADKITVLQDREATRVNVISALNTIYQNSREGDHVFVYYSGHGVSADSPTVDRAVKADLPACTGALVPFDYSKQESKQNKLDKLIIGRRDLFPAFERLDNGGRKLFVAFDTCYSGQAYRGGASAKETGNEQGNVKYVDDDTLGDMSYLQQGKMCSGSPYQNVFFLSASSENQTAPEGNQFTFDGKPHGYMTDAMLRLFQNYGQVDRNNNGLQYFELVDGVQTILNNMNRLQTISYAPKMMEHAPVADRLVFEKKIPHGTTPQALYQVGSIRIKLNGIEPGLADRITMIPGLQVVDSLADLALSKKGRDMMLYSGNGDLIKRFDNVHIEAVIKALQQQVMLVNTIKKNPGLAPINLQIELSGHSGTHFQEEDNLQFVISADQPADLLVLTIDSAGGVQLAYPDIFHEEPWECRLQPNHSCELPVLEITGPAFGSEYLIAFALTRSYPNEQALVNKMKSKNQFKGDERFMHWEDSELQTFLKYLHDNPNTYRSKIFTVVSEAKPK